MEAPTETLERALAAFRREQALAYQRALLGAHEEAGSSRGRAFLCSERAPMLLRDALATGELTPGVHAAFCAHVARAHAERAYEAARHDALRFAQRGLAFEGPPRPLGAQFQDWQRTRASAARARLQQAADPMFGAHALDTLRVRSQADAAAARALAELAGGRHPDAGPEGGVAQLAEQWLALTSDLAEEAFRFARQVGKVDGESGLDTLFAVQGSDLSGLLPAPGRYRRLAAEHEALGLRALLSRSARLGPAHPGLFGADQLALPGVPREIRLLPAQHALGLHAELTAADALGRATAHAHVSAALPLPLRHASAASVARSAGTLFMLRFGEPQFWRKHREASAREAAELARRSVAYALLDSRLAAAAVLARGLIAGADAAPRAQALCERALRGEVPEGIALWLLTRLSAGSAFRAKSWAPALIHALRERYNEDWYQNPRCADPLRGGFARGGELSVEAFAEELGAQWKLGPSKLSELF